jgi:radical SAM/Cys-rich protein
MPPQATETTSCCTLARLTRRDFWNKPFFADSDETPRLTLPMPDFTATLARHGLVLRRSAAPRVLQLNVGKLCNLTCSHCHVNAGPARKEIMSRETVDRILDWQRRARLPVVDLTGGAPEMMPAFRHLVTELRGGDAEVTIIDRCNLTILLEPGYEDMAEFLRAQRVEIVASMPCYSAENVNAQRGEGVFEASIAALQRLNGLGYGRVDGLPLHLVYNPVGALLPGPQAELEADYKRELRAHFGIEFHRLYTITNLPVSRFASWLRHQGRQEAYLELLVNAFNPATVAGLMCRDTINVGWEGELFDCDFNQMMGMRMEAVVGRGVRYLWELDAGALAGAAVATAPHCFGCTAGAGSSCGGSLLGAEEAAGAAASAGSVGLG